MNRYTPYSANAMPAAHSATNVLIMITSVILRRSENLRVHCILVIRALVPFPSRTRASDNSFELTFSRARPVAPTSMATRTRDVLHHKLNHSAGSDEIVHVRHRQNAGALQARQYLR